MIGQTLARELAGRKIDTNTQRLVRGVVDAPFLNLAADFTKSPVSDRENQPALLGPRNKIHWRHESALRMNPADQSFKSDNSARSKLDFRLIVEHKFTLLQRLAKIRSAWPCF